MGAGTFSNRISARTAQEGYEALVSTARHEYGHRPYTGTIAETRGFKMVDLRPGETLAACEDRVIAAAHPEHRVVGARWGPAACVDLGPDPAAPGLRQYAFFGWAAT